jgi:hypothetical protein
MASIWAQERGEKEPRKVRGYLDAGDAKKLIRSMVRRWSGPVVEAQAYDYLLFRTEAEYLQGRPCGSLFVEFFSPPSAPEPGQPTRPTSTSRG